MVDREQQLIREIDVISNNIRKKYRALKQGVLESDEMLHKSYKPILEPLKTITQRLHEKKPKIKKEEPAETLKEEEERKEEPEVDLPHFLDAPVVAETINDDDDDGEKIENMLNTPEGRREARRYFDSKFRSNSLANKYMRKIVSAERNRLMDYTYGVRHQDGKWMIGDSLLEIDEGDNFLINSIRYKGTPGLYELMFMKHPDKKSYDEEDLKAYKNILQDTNGHKLYYLSNTRINSNSGLKYKEIISHLFPPKYASGHINDNEEIYMAATNDRIDYVHWNDPNELVERLRLLMDSQQAGHSGHTNEIVSIVEELREAKIIV